MSILAIRFGLENVIFLINKEDILEKEIIDY